MAPNELGGAELIKTPATDPKTVIGRTITLPVSDVIKEVDADKYYMKISLKITSLNGKKASTVFNGFGCMREHILRLIRKRNQKIHAIFNVKTKDGWLLRITYLAVLTRNVPTTLQKELRRFIIEKITNEAKKLGVYELVKKVIDTKIQAEIKKEGSKLYPVRFSEVEKIKVLSMPQ